MSRAVQKGFNLMSRISREMSENTKKELVRAYKRSLKNVKGELQAIYEKYEKDGKLTYAEMTKYNRLKKLFDGVNEELLELTGEVSKLTKELAKDQYHAGFFQGGYVIEQLAGKSVVTNYGILNPKVVQAAVQNPISGLTLNERLQERRKEIIRECKASITQGLIRGESYAGMAKRITETFENDVVKANRVAQTEAHRCQQAGATYVIEMAAKKGIPVFKVWDAALDERTRAAHQILDGTKVKWDEDFKSPAGGIGPSPGQMGNAADDINCRCTIRPEIPGFEPEKRRERIGDSPEGKIINFTAYKEWAKSKGIPNAAVVQQTNLIKKVIEKSGFVPAETIKEAEQYIRDNFDYIKNTDYGNFDLEVANRVNEQFTKLAELYPEVAEQMASLSSCQHIRKLRYDLAFDKLAKKIMMERNVTMAEARRLVKVIYPDLKVEPVEDHLFAFSTNRGYYEAYDFYKDLIDKFNGIGFNEKYASDYNLFKSELNYSVNIRYHPPGCNTVESVMTHEFGHQMDHFFNMNDPQWERDVTDIHSDWMMECQRLVDSGYYINMDTAIMNTLCTYASHSKGEFIAEAFAEYHHNPNPREYALRVGKAAEDAFKRLRSKK